MAEHRYRKEEVDVGDVETKEPELKQLKAAREFDREQHEKRSLEAGLPPEKAKRHAEEDVESGEPYKDFK